MCPIFDSDFWNSFWPDFFSNVLTAVIFTFMVAYAIRQLRKPKLRICLNIGSGVQNSHSLDFFCVNSGSVGVMSGELQWHVYFPLAIMPDKENDMEYAMIRFDDRPWYHFSGSNAEPCLPGSSIRLALIPVKKNAALAKELGDFGSIDAALYYYSLTTVKGQKQYDRWLDIFSKGTFVDDSRFVKRRIFEIKEKVL